VSERPQPGSGSWGPRAAVSEDSLFDIAALSDVGTEREHNEDCCSTFLEGPRTALAAVADGVSGTVAGEEASQKAIEVTLRAFKEQDRGVAIGKRLVRAVQQANIEIYDRALIVPELRGMSTTLTAIAIDGGDLMAAHVGDSRLYLWREGRITQLTKDHTVTAERVRMGLLSEKKARLHPDRSTLTRSLGRELIVAVDRIQIRVVTGDILILCSDGLYNVLEDEEMAAVVATLGAGAAARALVDAANARGTNDNLTAAIVRIVGALPATAEPVGFLARLKGLVGMGS
jgi:PPM family protein phosphatase